MELGVNLKYIKSYLFKKKKKKSKGLGEAFSPGTREAKAGRLEFQQITQRITVSKQQQNKTKRKPKEFMANLGCVLSTWSAKCKWQDPVTKTTKS